MKTILLLMLIYPFYSISDQNLDMYYYTSQYVDIEYNNNGDITDVDPIFNEIYIDTKKKLIGFDATDANYITCNERDDLYCIVGINLYLAIPKNKSKWPKEWRYMNNEYTYIDDDNIKIFGKSYSFKIIQSKTTFTENKSEYELYKLYYYSIDDGLIGFSTVYVEDNTVSNYFMAQNQGLRLDLLEETLNSEKLEDSKIEEKTAQ